MGFAAMGGKCLKMKDVFFLVPSIPTPTDSKMCMFEHLEIRRNLLASFHSTMDLRNPLCFFANYLLALCQHQ
jgi:hypothetical protein